MERDLPKVRRDR